MQRGNNRLPCFLDGSDRLRYLTMSRKALPAAQERLHADVLMDYHVDLQTTPPACGALGPRPRSVLRPHPAWLALSSTAGDRSAV